MAVAAVIGVGTTAVPVLTCGSRGFSLFFCVKGNFVYTRQFHFICTVCICGFHFISLLCGSYDAANKTTAS